MSRKNKANPNQRRNPEAASLDSLIAALRSEDGMARQRAREALVAMGGPAVTRLVEELADANYVVRWEAAKALGEIGDPAAAPALVGALEDDEFGVRWLAAEGLIGLGRDSLDPLLKALVERGQFPRLREGAHHVFRYLATSGLHDQLAPVLAALEGIDPATEVLLAAETAMATLRRESD